MPIAEMVGSMSPRMSDHICTVTGRSAGEEMKSDTTAHQEIIIAKKAEKGRRSWKDHVPEVDQRVAPNVNAACRAARRPCAGRQHRGEDIGIVRTVWVVRPVNVPYRPKPRRRRHGGGKMITGTTTGAISGLLTIDAPGKRPRAIRLPPPCRGQLRCAGWQRSAGW